MALCAQPVPVWVSGFLICVSGGRSQGHRPYGLIHGQPRAFGRPLVSLGEHGALYPFCAFCAFCAFELAIASCTPLVAKIPSHLSRLTSHLSRLTSSQPNAAFFVRFADFLFVCPDDFRRDQVRQLEGGFVVHQLFLAHFLHIRAKRAGQYHV